LPQPLGPISITLQPRRTSNDSSRTCSGSNSGNRWARHHVGG
jgi:hypothetical protein